jgi:C_GCAxxG_C_C family probable redox protein
MADTAQSIAAAADRYFHEGHNCAQAVLKAVAEAKGFACPSCIPGVALAMGGGVGHTGHVCGAVTGAVMAIGLAMDRTVPGDVAARKRAAYGVAGEFVKSFAARFGSADCRGILGFGWSEPGAMDRFRREGLLDAKCAPCVRWSAAEAARIIDELVAPK